MRTINGNNQNILYLPEKDPLLPAKPLVRLTRCWSKDAESLWQHLEHATEMAAVCPFDLIVLSVDHRLDNGQTQEALQSLQHPLKDRVTLLSVDGPADQKNWTRLLNGPIRYLRELGMNNGYIMPVSFEAQLDVASLAPLRPILQTSGHEIPFLSQRHAQLHRSENQSIDVVGALDALVDYYLKGVDLSENHLSALQNGQRNTGCFWRWKTLLRLRGFDSRCNAWGGQEDTHLLLRALASYGCDWRDQIGTRLLHYHDPRLHAVTEERQAVQAAKYQAEQSAIRQALEAVATDGYLTHPDDCDFSFT